MKWSQAERDVWAPPIELSMVEWAESNIVLGGDTELKGPLRVRNAPYSEAIFELVDDPRIERIVVRKSAQIGGTVMFLIVHLFRAIVRAKSSLIVYADEKVAIKVIEEKLFKLVDSSPAIRREVASRTQYSIRFKNGARIDIAWASSVASLATFEYSDVCADEVDKPGYYRATKEADPVSLLAERTETFYDRKIFVLSTPSTEEGKITKELQACEVIYDLHIPCPHCGQFQPLIFNPKHAMDFKDGTYIDKDGKEKTLGQVTWEGGSKATREEIEKTAGYACGECGVIWTTIEKNKAVEKYILVPRERIDYQHKTVGVNIWRIYSLLGKSGDIARIVYGYVNSLGDNKRLQGVVNSCFAQPWRTIISQTTEDEILKARSPGLEPRTTPEDAICLTMGVDVQAGKLVYTVWAWARNWTSWLIDYGEVAWFDDLWEFISSRAYPGPNGPMTIWRMGLDIKSGVKTGENLTSSDEAYQFINNHKFRGIELYACAGFPALGQKVRAGNIMQNTPSGHRLPGGIQLMKMDTDIGNTSFLDSLKAAREGTGFQPAYLHKDTGKDFAWQITGIEPHLNEKTGVREWRKVHAHDYFDATKIARGLVDITFPKGGLEYFQARRTVKKVQATEQQTDQRQTRISDRLSASRGRVINPLAGRR